MRPTSISTDSRRLFVKLAVVAALSASVCAANWSYSGERLDGRIRGGVLFARAVTDAHEAMLDQETGLRAFAASGSPTFLQPYREGRKDQTAALAEAWELAPSAAVRHRLLEVQEAASTWQLDYAAPLLAQLGGARVLAADDRRWQQGKVLFDAYRVPQAALLKTVRATNDRNMVLRRRADRLANTLVLVLALVGLAVAVRRRRALQAELTGPLAELREVVRRLADGDTGATAPRRYDLAEVESLAEELRGLANTAESRRSASEREGAALSHRADTYRRALHVANDLSVYLEPRELGEALVGALRQVVGVDAAVLQRMEDGRLQETLATYPEGRALALDAATEEALRFLRPTVSPDGQCLVLPVVHSGQAHALLRVRVERGVDEDVRLAVTALALAAGGALTAARLHQQVRSESRTDALTGLRNRRRFEEDLEQELGLAGRNRQPVSLLLLDVDHFKRFNDTRGHREGDRLLQDLASLLTLTLRGTDSAYRYGGEELAVVLRGTDGAGAGELAERLRGVVAGRTSVTVSVGVATTASAVSPDELVEAADAALYEAKAAGRNTVRASAGAAPVVEVPLARAPEEQTVDALP